MYKFGDNQIRFEDFHQPVGLKMDRNNRWVKKAESIPWEEIEKRYAKLFTNNKGNVAKPLRLALGSCIIQNDYGFSDEETVLQIQETPYLQFFCGLPGFTLERPFDPSLMVYFRKRLTVEILKEVNEMVIEKAVGNKVKNDDDDQSEPPQNKGTMIIDATCAPSNIKFPQDTELLNEARENTEKLIDKLHNPKDGKKPRTYRKIARKNHLKIARKRKKTSKDIRKATGQQLGYIRRNVDIIDAMLENGKELTDKDFNKLTTIKKLYEQQKYMRDNRTHSVSERIVSLSQPHIRPIVRGKAKAKVEFGAKLDISVVDGWTRLEKLSFDAYNESATLIEAIERYKQRTGSYPERVLADKIYRNRDNLKYCKEWNIRLSGPALGRPKKGEVRNKRQDYIDEGERIEVERKFSLAKRKCGMGMIMTKLPETAMHSIAMSIITLNLRKVLFALFDLVKFLFYFLLIRKQQKNKLFVQ
ncbi:MAG: IS5 family transposase [Clostridiales bacterium]|nr:IS5 family transposase [Clostridiales bacterium]